MRDSVYFNSIDTGERAKFIGVVEDCIRTTSQNGNKYIKVLLSDELGNFQGIMVDSSRQRTCSNYIEDGHDIPVKDNIVVIVGRKGEDIIFVDDMSIMDEKIYMKLADLK